MATFPRDDNFVPITDKDGIIVTKTVTFAAATTGAVDTHTIFTVTGANIVKVIGYCSVNLAGSGTIEVGVAGVTNALIAQTTGTDIDAGEFWVDNAPAVIESDPSGKVTALDISYTIGTDTLTGGTITFYCFYRPMSSTSSVVAA